MNIGMLGLPSPFSTHSEIRRRYQRLAKAFHPDKVSPGLRAASTAVSDELNQIYKTLSNPLAMFIFSHYGHAGLVLYRANRKEFAALEECCLLSEEDAPALLRGHAHEVERLISRLYYAGLLAARCPFFLLFEYSFDLRRRGLARPAVFSLNVPVLMRGRYALSFSAACKGTLGQLRAKLGARCDFFYRLGPKTVSASLSYCLSSRRAKLEQAVELGRKWTMKTALHLPAPRTSTLTLRRPVGPSKGDALVLSASAAGANARVSRKFKLGKRARLVPQLAVYGQLRVADLSLEVRRQTAKSFRVFAQIGAQVRADLTNLPRVMLGYRQTLRGFAYSAGIELNSDSPAFFLHLDVLDYHLRIPVPIVALDQLIAGCGLLCLTGLLAHVRQAVQDATQRRLLFRTKAAQIKFINDALTADVFVPPTDVPRPVSILRALLVSRDDSWRLRRRGAEKLPAVDVTGIVELLYAQKGCVAFVAVLETLSALRQESVVDVLGQPLKVVIEYRCDGQEKALQLSAGQSTNFGFLSRLRHGL